MRMTAALFGGEEARRRLDERAERARDLTGAWDRILPQLRKQERLIFATHGHGQWPANSPRTIARKGRNTPMFQSGRLFRALSLAKARYSIARRTMTSLLFGVNPNSDVFYTRFVGKDRPFMLDKRTARRIATDYVDQWIGAHRR